MDAGITDGVSVTVVAASSRCADRYWGCKRQGMCEYCEGVAGTSGSSESGVHRADRYCPIC